MTNNKFSYAYFYQSVEDTSEGDTLFVESYIILIIFELYGNDSNNLLVRYYKINLLLYNLANINDLKLFNLNSFFGLGFIGHDLDSNLHKSIFLIFGYPNKEFNEDITEII